MHGGRKAHRLSQRRGQTNQRTAAELKDLSDDPVSLQARLFSGHAREYARLWSPVILPMGRRLLHALPLAGAARILDVGAGTGALIPDMRALAPDAALAGVDRAEGMLRIAHENGRIPLAVMDAQRLAVQTD